MSKTMAKLLTKSADKSADKLMKLLQQVVDKVNEQDDNLTIINENIIELNKRIEELLDK